MKMKKFTPNIILSVLLSAGLVACNDDDDNNNRNRPTLDIVETATADGRFNTLVAAVGAAGLAGTLQSEGPFTVFAPTDAAFTTLLTDAGITADDLLANPGLADILTYHVNASRISSSAAIDAAGTTIDTVNGAKLAVSLNGNDLYINTSKVIVADVDTTNGVIHALDKVLSVPKPVPAEASIACGEADALPTMAAIAQDPTQPFSTLVAAVSNADNSVLTTLDSAGSLTLFAPTNDAFANIDEAVLNDLLGKPNELTNVLLNHVYTGGAVDAVTAYSLNGVTVPTENVGGDGELSILIDPDSRNLTVEGSTVTATDVYACNGIIHVIDTVIL